MNESSVCVCVGGGGGGVNFSTHSYLMEDIPWNCPSCVYVIRQPHNYRHNITCGTVGRFHYYAGEFPSLEVDTSEMKVIEVVSLLNQ